MRYTDPVDSEIAEQVRTSFGWGIAIGIIMTLLGIVAIARPLYATIASALVFGWLFIIAGIVQFVYAFRSKGIGQLIWKVLLGILYLIAGIYVVATPAIGAVTLTLVLGVTIFVQGVVEVIMAFQLRRAAGWVWVLFSGIISIILGILIWSRFPGSAEWFVGLWVGLHLLVSGIWILTLSSAIRSVLR